MKLTSIAGAIALFTFTSGAHALDKDKYAPIASAMMKFPDDPTEARFRAIEAKMAALPPLDYKSDDDQHVIAISVAFLVGAHNRHHWPIGQKGKSLTPRPRLSQGKERSLPGSETTKK